MFWYKTQVLVLSMFSAAAFAHPVSPVSSSQAEHVQSSKKAESFKPFTGKVSATKVRIRSKADYESQIIRQANKGELLLVIGEEGDFWAIQPPKGTKAYVFRSYVLDNVVEANRVNVRLEPHIDAPIIAQLQTGDKVNGTICTLNNKWLEIAPPSGARFYISKEYVTQAGGPEYLSSMEKKRTEVEQLINSAFFLAEAECKKNYEEMSPQEAIEKFQLIISSYADFPEFTQQAKEGLALLKDTYLQKKIAYLEARSDLSASAKDDLLEKQREEQRALFQGEAITSDPALWNRHRGSKIDMTDRVRFWSTVEESLYLSWTAFHSGKKLEDFYDEQRANATILTGTLETYEHAVKNKPGDYILRNSGIPLAYLYSTQVDLEKMIGQTVTVLVSQRPNNHFAFPAYFVLSVEK